MSKPKQEVHITREEWLPPGRVSLESWVTEMPEDDKQKLAESFRDPAETIKVITELKAKYC